MSNDICPTHPDNSFFIISQNILSKQHLQCTSCFSKARDRYMISFDEITSQDPNVIMKEWPIQNDKDIYMRLIKASTYEKQLEELQNKILDYFKNLRSLIDKTLAEKEGKMLKQAKCLYTMHEDAIHQYNKFAAKVEINKIIQNQQYDFQLKNAFLNEIISNVLKNQDRNKQSLIGSLDRLETEERKMNFTVPDQIQDIVIQLIESIDMFGKKDLQDINISIQRDLFSFQKVNINKTKPSQITTSQKECQQMNKSHEVSHSITSVPQLQTNEGETEVVNRIFSNLDKYQKNKYLIYKELNNKKYKLSKHLFTAYFEDYFEGYVSNTQGVEQKCLFKILPSSHKEIFDNEVTVLKSLINNANIVRLIDSFSIGDLNVIVLEECLHSLQNELDAIKQRNIPFDLKLLLKIIFDCLDGLFQLALNDVTHFDIRPCNILKTKQELYTISNLGLSHKRAEGEFVFKCKSNTATYSPQEQIQKSVMGYHCDVYSMGMTFNDLLGVFKFLNIGSSLSIIKDFEDIINMYMIQDDYRQRKYCMEIHKLFFQKSSEYKGLLQYYPEQVEKIIDKIQEAIEDALNNQEVVQMTLNKFKIYYLKVKVQLLEYNLREYRSAMNCYEEISKCYEKINDSESAYDYYLKALHIDKYYFNSELSKSVKEQFSFFERMRYLE